MAKNLQTDGKLKTPDQVRDSLCVYYVPGWQSDKSHKACIYDLVVISVEIGYPWVVLFGVSCDN